MSDNIMNIMKVHKDSSTHSVYCVVNRDGWFIFSYRTIADLKFKLLAKAKKYNIKIIYVNNKLFITDDGDFDIKAKTMAALLD